MKPFKHINAGTVNEAVKLLKNSGGKARLMSGGTDLIGILKDKVLPEYPETIINIKTIRNLDYIREDARGLKIGALVRLDEIVQSQTVKEKYKLLADAAESVATPQIRHMGTIGGNLCQDVRCWYYRYPDHVGGQINCYLKGGRGCNAMTGDNRYHSVFGGRRANDPSSQPAGPGRTGSCVSANVSDIGVALVALDAGIKIAGAGGVRTISIAEFFGSVPNCLKQDEMVTEIQIPQPSDGARQIFIKYRLREAIDFAIVSLASIIAVKDGVCKEASISLGAVAPRPIRAVAAEQALKGRTINNDTIEAAAEASVTGAIALGKNAYKIEIIKALVKRALV